MHTVVNKPDSVWALTAFVGGAESGQTRHQWKCCNREENDRRAWGKVSGFVGGVPEAELQWARGSQAAGCGPQGLPGWLCKGSEAGTIWAYSGNNERRCQSKARRRGVF